MELTFAQQSLAFLWSIALGAAYGVIYGAVKILRLALRFGRAVCIARRPRCGICCLSSICRYAAAVHPE